MNSRRGLILGVAAFLAAPSIVRASALMPLGSVRWERLNWYRVTADHSNLTGWILYGQFRNEQEALSYDTHPPICDAHRIECVCTGLGDLVLV